MSIRHMTEPSTGSPDRADGPSSWVARHQLLSFIAVAYTITWTLLIGGFLAVAAGVLDPEGSATSVMVQVAAAGPLIAAVAVAALGRGRAGLASLGRSMVRWRVNPLCYALVFLGVPAVMLAGLSLFYGDELVPRLVQNSSLLYTKLPPDVLLIAVVTGLAEEPGWRGVAQPAANRRFQPLLAALLVSVVWAAWHLPNALFVQNITESATHFLATAVSGFLYAWVYNSTRSVLIAMLLHGALNATNGLTGALFEGASSAPSPTAYYLISALVFGAVMVVVAVLTRGRLGLPPAEQTHDH